MRSATTMIKDLNKLLYSFAMFDGHLGYIGGSKNACLVINMLETHLDYIEKVVTTLEKIPLKAHISFPPIYNKDGFTRQQQVRLQSNSHPIFSKIHNRIYFDGRKVVDPHMLTLMDAEMLAIMFMTDGSRYLDKRWENAKPNYRLHLNNLSYGDLMLIKKALKEKLEIEINTRKKGDRFDLAVPTAFSEKFEKTIQPFILPSFQYKIER